VYLSLEWACVLAIMCWRLNEAGGIMFSACVFFPLSYLVCLLIGEGF
jgi:hypothetical protein